MKEFNLLVPAMQSEHCQNKVKQSVEHMREIKITSLKPGSIQIGVPEDYMLRYIYTAIQSAGYEIMGVETDAEALKSGQVLQFKSNINCMGCVNAIAPALNGHDGIEGWQVDLKSADKVLTVETAGISKSEIIALVKSKGYKAESI